MSFIQRLDHFSESQGLKKNFVVEQALLFFMEARRELPDEALVPSRLIVEDKVFDHIAQLLANPPALFRALRWPKPVQAAPHRNLRRDRRGNHRWLRHGYRIFHQANQRSQPTIAHAFTRVPAACPALSSFGR